MENTYLLILTWQIRVLFPPELFIWSGVTWMIAISQTSTVKMEWSINRNISKFNSGLCFWTFYQFILSSSETLGSCCLLLITICSRWKQPLVSNDFLSWALSSTASKGFFLFKTCTLFVVQVYRYVSIVILKF